MSKHRSSVAVPPAEPRARAARATRSSRYGRKGVSECPDGSARQQSMKASARASRARPSSPVNVAASRSAGPPQNATSARSAFRSPDLHCSSRSSSTSSVAVITSKDAAPGPKYAHGPFGEPAAGADLLTSLNSAVSLLAEHLMTPALSAPSMGRALIWAPPL